jgi:hypothetical protein
MCLRRQRGRDICTARTGSDWLLPCASGAGAPGSRRCTQLGKKVLLDPATLQPGICRHDDPREPEIQLIHVNRIWVSGEIICGVVWGVGWRLEDFPRCLLWFCRRYSR